MYSNKFLEFFSIHLAHNTTEVANVTVTLRPGFDRW